MILEEFLLYWVPVILLSPAFYGAFQFWYKGRKVMEKER